MLDPIFRTNEVLRNRLTRLVENTAGISLALAHYESAGPAPNEVSPQIGVPLHVVVTANEVNDLHGTGPLIKRVCKGWRNILSIRARDDWGVQDFGDWNVCLSPRARTRSEFFHNVLKILRGQKVATVLCVPYLPDEFLASIALHECFGAKLCVWLMDDQNVASRNIPDALMRELLERSSLRLATHPELRFAYERKYGMTFHILPAIVPGHLVSGEAKLLPTEANSYRKGALIGSFWDQSWFDRLCAALSRCDCQIDWFGNNVSPWLKFPEESLRRAGIKAHGIVPEKYLAEQLAKYPFVIVPVGAIDEHEANVGVARLSLPGRILFALATSHTPVLIVGSTRTCAARFVRHFSIGDVVPYEDRAISDAMDRLTRRDNQVLMRQKAAQIGPALSDEGVADWLTRSIELGRPADTRFEDLFAGYNTSIDLDSFLVKTA